MLTRAGIYCKGQSVAGCLFAYVKGGEALNKEVAIDFYGRLRENAWTAIGAPIMIGVSIPIPSSDVKLLR